MKIAVIGGGISGIGAALALKDVHDVTLFESADRFGGHANTQVATLEGVDVPVDTGFIVYNYRNYPNLTGMFDHLGVPTKWSDMSLGMSLKGGLLEYACDSIDKVFAQRRNCLNLGFLKLLSEIQKFHRTASDQLDKGLLDHLSLGDWLDREGYSRAFQYRFLLPMGGAIWSTPVNRMLEFPARNFVTFFRNHDLMKTLEAAQRWRTVDGGSIEYVSRAVAALGTRAVANAPVSAVTRHNGRVTVTFADGSEGAFDQVVMATHGPVSARLLQNQSDMERDILSSFQVSHNETILHSDTRLMPRRRKVWSSWNFLTEKGGMNPTRPAPVTYWMNRLQSIPTELPLFVSLNPLTPPDPDLVHGRYSYDHPVFDKASFEAQSRIDHIQGTGGVWYAGAYLGYGFHEDGLRSGLRVASALGARPAWAKTDFEPFASPIAVAAE